jgi:hypothetical protein
VKRKDVQALDVEGYAALPEPRKQAVQAWFADNGINLSDVFRVIYGRGAVIVHRYERGSDGKFIVGAVDGLLEARQDVLADGWPL